jgi:hypothetical protein
MAVVAPRAGYYLNREVQIFLAAQQMPSICMPAWANTARTSACGNGSPIARQLQMPWVLLTEAVEGGWGLAGTAFGKEEFAALAARAGARP